MKCIRYVANVSRNEHITPHRETLGLLKMFDRRTLHIAAIINKIINKKNTRSVA